MGSAAQAAFEGVSERFEPGGERPGHGVDLGEEFFVAPFGFFLAVDFAVVGLDDVVPDGVEEFAFSAFVEPAESIAHDLRVAARRAPVGSLTFGACMR